MNRILFVILFCAMLAKDASTQHHDHPIDVFQLDWKKEAILLGSGIALTSFGDYLLRNAERASLDEVLQLDANDLWGIDRGATNNFSSSAERTSDIILFTSAALPFAVYLLDPARGIELESVIMAAETFLITNGITNIVKASVKRYRPFNYNPDVDLEMKLGGSSRLSFFSGHASNTAAFCFLSAKILSELHPHWGKGKKAMVWSLAASLPLAISYGRYKAGKHFPTDVLTGYVFGATVGYLVPQWHKDKAFSIEIGPGSFSLGYTF